MQSESVLVGWTAQPKENSYSTGVQETIGCSAVKLKRNNFAPQHFCFPSESSTKAASSLHVHATSEYKFQ